MLRLMIISFMIVFFISIYTSFFSSSQADEIIGTITSVEGLAKVKGIRASSFSKIKNGDRLTVGTIIRTYSGNSVEVSFTDRSTIKLDEKSELGILKYAADSSVVLLLHTGQIKSQFSLSTNKQSQERNIYLVTNSAALKLNNSWSAVSYNNVTNSTSVVVLSGVIFAVPKSIVTQASNRLSDHDVHDQLPSLMNFSESEDMLTLQVAAPRRDSSMPKEANTDLAMLKSSLPTLSFSEDFAPNSRSLENFISSNMNGLKALELQTNQRLGEVKNQSGMGDNSEYLSSVIATSATRVNTDIANAAKKISETKAINVGPIKFRIKF